MTAERLAAMLAERIMGWKVGPAPYMMGGRQWQTHWRFQPVLRMADAIRLLEQAAAEEFATGAGDGGGFWARVRAAGVDGEARIIPGPRIDFHDRARDCIQPRREHGVCYAHVQNRGARSLPWQECRGRSQKAMETARDFPQTAWQFYGVATAQLGFGFYEETQLEGGND